MGQGFSRRRLVARTAGATWLAGTWAGIAACGLSGQSEAEQAVGPSKAPVSLRYTHGWGAGTDPLLSKMLADFMAANPNVKAEAVRPGGDLHEGLVRALAAGTPPDVTMMWRNNMPAFAAKRSLTGLDPYLARDKFDRTIYYENEFRSSQFLGKTYVLPAAAAGAWYLLFYNQSHLADAGLDPAKPPQTWDELTRYAGLLTKRGADGRIERLGFDPGSHDAGVYNSPFTGYLMANGGKYSSDDGRKLLFDSPQATGMLDWMLQVLRQNGGRDAVLEFFTRGRKNTHQALLTGERTLYVTNHSLPGAAREVQGLRYGIALMPRGSQQGSRGIVRGGWSNAVPAGVAAPYESWLLLRHLCATKEAAGWFMVQQVRPSPIKAVNESPDLTQLPNWDVIKQALATDTLAPVTPMDPDIDKLTSQAILDVYGGKPPKDAVSFAQQSGQRLLDEFWASVAPK
jgi:ABC-type glycerol-3-phosphate transport system substrate-binding protein